MILCLGSFVFSMHTTSYQSVERQSEWRIAEHQRIGQRPLLQFVGTGKDEISIVGVLYPQAVKINQLANTLSRIGSVAQNALNNPADLLDDPLQGLSNPLGTSGAGSIERLRSMASTGDSYALVDQFGWVYGRWAIRSVQEKQSEYLYGAAQKIEFTLALIRDEDIALATGSSLRRAAQSLLQ